MRNEAELAMTIERAEAELADLKSKIEQMEAKLRPMQSRVHDLDVYLRVARELVVTPLLQPDKSNTSQDRASHAPRQSAPRRGGVGDAVRAVAIDLITQAGRPMTARELVDAITPRGFVFGGGDPKKDTSDLSAKLAKAPELVGKRGLGWSLRGEDELLAEEDAAEQELSPDDQRDAAWDL